MPKLPKLSDFTDISGLMNKIKTTIDNLTGPSGSAISEEALANESDPIKAKLLEVELLINQLYEMMVIQNKTINLLQSKYAEVKKIASDCLSDSQPTMDSVNDKTVETQDQSNKSNKDEPPVV